MRGMTTTIFAILFAGLGLAAAPEEYRAPNNEAMAWRWNARYLSWATSNAGTRNEFDNRDAIRRRVQELKKLGITVVQLNGLHRRMAYMDRMPKVKEYTKMLVEECHREGIKVIEHHSLTHVSYANPTGYGAKWLFAHPDWLQRDIQYGYAYINPCMNNPDFRKYYFDYICDYIRYTDVDGLKLDEVVFCSGRTCGCPHCRAKFKRETGLEIPRDTTDSFFEWDERRRLLKNRSDPRVARFLEWRADCRIDFFTELRKRINRIKPNFTLMTYTTHYGLTSYYSTIRGGASLVKTLRIHDWIGTEIMSRNVYACPRAIFFFRRAVAALGNYGDVPVYGLVYHVDNPEIAKMGWALNTMNRELTLMSAIEGADMAYIGWPDLMNFRFARSEADIALLFSDANRVWARITAFVPDLGGYSQCLADAHIQHDIILDLALDAEHLKKYRLLIVPSVGCMSDSQVQALRDYVRGGGRLILTAHSSKLTELGMERDDFALRDLVNLSYRGVGPKQCRFKMGTAVVPLDRRPFRVDIVEPGRSEVIATLLDANGVEIGPAIVRTPFGNGEVFYDACQLGSYNYEPEVTVGRKYQRSAEPTLKAVLIKLVRRAHGGPLPFEAGESIPEKVFISVYRQRVNAKEQVLVHLLNATGSNMKPGQMVTRTTPKDPWPALEKDLEFEITLPDFERAYVVSPDFDGRRPVKVEREGSRCRVTVNRDDLRWFSTVYFDLRE